MAAWDRADLQTGTEIWGEPTAGTHPGSPAARSMPGPGSSALLGRTRQEWGSLGNNG